MVTRQHNSWVCRAQTPAEVSARFVLRDWTRPRRTWGDPRRVHWISLGRRPGSERQRLAGQDRLQFSSWEPLGPRPPVLPRNKSDSICFPTPPDVVLAICEVRHQGLHRQAAAPCQPPQRLPLLEQQNGALTSGTPSLCPSHSASHAPCNIDATAGSLGDPAGLGPRLPPLSGGWMNDNHGNSLGIPFCLHRN